MCFLVYRADLVCREFERSTANQLSRYRINEKKIPFLERVAQMSTVFLQQRKESISLIDVRLFRSTVSIEVTRWFLRTVRAWRFVLQLRLRSKKSIRESNASLLLIQDYEIKSEGLEIVVE